jgi:Fe2+ transport system protein FeoA
MQKKSPLPLSMAQTDQTLVVRGMRAEPDMQSRLAAMGLHPGVEIKVISRSVHGPCIIVVKDSRLVLDRKLAHQILVG